MQTVDLRDVGVIQRREDFRFALETRQPFRVRGKGGRKDLDRDLPLQFRVGRAVNLAHSTVAERSGHFIQTEASAGRERQGERDYTRHPTPFPSYPDVSLNPSTADTATAPPTRSRLRMPWHVRCTLGAPVQLRKEATMSDKLHAPNSEETMAEADVLQLSTTDPAGPPLGDTPRSADEDETDDDEFDDEDEEDEEAEDGDETDRGEQGEGGE